MLGRVIAQEPRPIAVQDSASGEHLRIEQRPARQQPMEKPAVPVGPFHHGGDRESSIERHFGVPNIRANIVCLQRKIDIIPTARYMASADGRAARS